MGTPSPPPDEYERLTRKRGLTAIDGANALIAVLVIMQMWILTSALESFLAGHHDATLPAAIISGVLLLACVLLYRFVQRGTR
jgi:hypothetical protein